jgi:hypothetical protein
MAKRFLKTGKAKKTFMARCETREELENTYGRPIGGVWGGEKQFMVMYTPPPTVTASWINTATGAPVKRLYINKDMKDALDLALTNVFKRSLVSQLESFDGVFLVRAVRGDPSLTSLHSFGLAIDINAATNKLGEEPTISPELVKCFTDANFCWGGTFTRKDGMHFSYFNEKGDR